MTCACGKPSKDATICRDCTTRLEKALRQIPWLAEQLEITETRQDVMGRQAGGKPHGKDVEKPLFFNAGAASTTEDIQITLNAWCRELGPDKQILGGPVCRICAHESCREHILDVWPANNLPSLSGWLLAHIRAINLHEAAAEMFDEITYAVSQAWRAVDRPANRARVYVSACLDVSCDGDLYARIPTADYVEADESTHAAITCTECDARYPAKEWMSVGRRIRAMKETA